MWSKQSSLNTPVIIATTYVVLAIIGQGIPPFKIFTLDVSRIYAIIIFGVLSIIILLRQNKAIQVERSFVFLASLFIYSIISLTWSVYPAQSLPMLFSFFLALVSISVFLSCTQSISDFTNYISALLVVAAFLIIISLTEFIFGVHLPVSRLSTPAYADQFAASAIFYNRNDLGFFLGMVSPFALRYIFDGNPSNEKILGYLVYIGSLCTVLLNQSRTATLVVLGSTIAMFCGRRITNERLPFSRLPRVGLLAYFFSAIAIWILPFVFTNPFHSQSLRTRWRLIQVSIDLLQSHPLGVGPGSFPQLAPQTDILVYDIFATHNWALKMGVELGVVGLLIFILLAGLLVDQLFSNSMMGDFSGFSLPFGVSLLFVPFGALGPSNALVHTRIFWLVLAMAIVYVSFIGASGGEADCPI